MHDQDIRRVLRKRLAECYGTDPDTAIIDELSIRGGRNRVDLALVNGVLHGFELKSDYDTLCRLPDQVSAYNAVCDRVTLVVAERHIKHAIEIIPDWWGVRVVRGVRGKSECLVFRDFKLAQTNPSVNPIAVAQMLYRREASELLANVGAIDGAARMPRRQLCRLIADKIELRLLCDYVRRCIRARQSAVPRHSYGDSVRHVSMSSAIRALSPSDSSQECSCRHR